MQSYKPHRTIADAPTEYVPSMPGSGLTKRELFAALAMQAIIESQLIPLTDPSAVSVMAIRHADKLIEQLNENLES
jgi:hypothetical protein